MKWISRDFRLNKSCRGPRRLSGCYSILEKFVPGFQLSSSASFCHRIFFVAVNRHFTPKGKYTPIVPTFTIGQKGTGLTASANTKYDQSQRLRWRANFRRADREDRTSSSGHTFHWKEHSVSSELKSADLEGEDLSRESLALLYPLSTLKIDAKHSEKFHRPP